MIAFSLLRGMGPCVGLVLEREVGEGERGLKSVLALGGHWYWHLPSRSWTLSGIGLRDGEDWMGVLGLVGERDSGESGQIGNSSISIAPEGVYVYPRTPGGRIQLLTWDNLKAFFLDLNSTEALPDGDIVKRTAEILREMEDQNQDGTFPTFFQL
ncbi:hypothetical protein BT69DRAFT_1352515 [Atractiella rhizophila]|nr:hypothetical protein BT69DRAFT_1352515 [Atractiella rhizophila]